MADVEAMFHQVFVTKQFTDYLRFLWWTDGDMNQQPATYRMLVHLFGATSSPSCASAALKQTALDNIDHYDSSVTDVVSRDFYVDDCLASADTENDATRLVKDVTSLCARGGFLLTKWTSSSIDVIQSIPIDERGKAVKSVGLDPRDLPAERALGVQWSMDSDTLGFSVTPRNYTATRRGILSAVSAVYDPLGIASPFVLTAKILLQELCSRNVGWDTPLTEADNRKWNKWLTDLPNLDKLKLERCYKPKDFGTVESCQLHYFSDASDKGYGVACYIRQTDDTRQVSSSLVMAKSRVTPLKKVTIPRLELTAATLSVRLDHLIKRELDCDVDKTFYWTDSVAVLNYIANDSTRFQTFVANRLTVIRESSSKEQWRYISTKLNPADVASRGQSVTELVQNKSWLHGPEFLNSAEETWLHPMDYSQEPDQLTVTSTIPEPQSMDRLLTRFSSWSKLVRITARIAKGFENLKIWISETKQLEDRIIQSENDPVKRQILIDRETKKLKQERLINSKVSSFTVPSADQLKKAEIALLRYVQKQHFRDEIESLLKKNSRVQKSSPAYRLDPFMRDGLLHVGGRLSRADIPYRSRHPVLLPRSSPVSHLILAETHRLVGHLGRNSVLSKVRENYWILGAGTLVKHILAKCVNCRKYQSPKSTQKMADLPSDRLEANTPPFSNIGMDYFGPFEVKRGRSTVKRYGVIFTCLVTRAVHLEVAHSLDADSCLNAIRRFIARRGSPTVIRSDNGTNLVASERVLREEICKMNQQKIGDTLAVKQIRWEFNPPTASHFGGVWERLIRSVRKVLNSMLHEQIIRLDDEGLHTLLCEVESILNGRPITESPNHPCDLEALTPNHLLMLRKGEDTPPGLFAKHDNFAQRRWRQIQFLADTFWRRWVKQYLPLLQNELSGKLVVRTFQKATSC